MKYTHEHAFLTSKYHNKLHYITVDIDNKLWPNRDEFRLITFPGGTVAKLVIEEIKLLVCKVKLSPATILAHAAVLRENNALYPYQKQI